MDRNEIRARFLNAKPKSKIVEVFGTSIELRQPTLRDILKAQQSADPMELIVLMLINYCHVPGTTEHVFERADVEGLLQMPFGKDFSTLQEAINELAGVDVQEAKQELEKGPSH